MMFPTLITIMIMLQITFIIITAQINIVGAIPQFGILFITIILLIDYKRR
jgi:hypothetical protein